MANEGRMLCARGHSSWTSFWLGGEWLCPLCAAAHLDGGACSDGIVAAWNRTGAVLASLVRDAISRGWTRQKGKYDDHVH